MANQDIDWNAYINDLIGASARKGPWVYLQNKTVPGPPVILRAGDNIRVVTPYGVIDLEITHIGDLLPPN